MGFRYVYIVGEIFLAGIFLVAVMAGIRSWPWKAIWLVAAGSLWYFAGLFGAAHRAHQGALAGDSGS
jgi:hypothetical protein